MECRTPILLSLIVTMAMNVAMADELALVGGSVIDVRTGQALANAVVIVQGERIKAVGGRHRVRVPSTAKVIDISGKWVLPGYVDSHVHFFQSGGLYTRPDMIDLRTVVPYEQVELPGIKANLADTLQRYLRSGITTVVDVGGPMWNLSVRAFSREEQRIDKSPRVFVAGPLLAAWCPDETRTADPPIIVVRSPEEARDLVRREVDAGVDLIKLWILGPEDREGLTVENQMPWVEAAIDEAHRRQRKVVAHATHLEVARAAVAAGVDILAHGVTDKSVDDAFVESLRSNKTVYTTTGAIWEGLAEVLSHSLRFTAAEMEMANPHVLGTLLDSVDHPTSYRPDDAALFRKELHTALENLRRVADAGVTIAVGTDAGNIGTVPGPSIFRELELMRQAGLTPLRILQSLTLSGAELVGTAAQAGTVEAGKLADLVVLNRNPLLDIRHASDIAAVMKGGHWRDAAQLDVTTPTDVVQRQVNAYNAHDLGAFLNTYSDDARIYDLQGTLELEGRNQLRKVYGRPDHMTSHVWIRERIELGNLVIDHESKSDPPGFQAVVIYEVEGGRISKVHIVREPPGASARP